MVDAKLQLTIDSSGAQRGADNFVRSSNKIKKSAKDTSKEVKNTGNALSKVQNELRKTASTIAIVDGPLGGVASRFNALATLLGRITPRMIAFTAATIGLSAILRRGLVDFIPFEQAIGRLDSLLISTGINTKLTAEEIDIFAKQLGRATLTSRQAVLDATAAILPFASVTEENFRKVIKSAQDLTEVFGGNLRSNARLLARALEDPAAALTLLERQGINFTKQQKEIIRALVETGQKAIVQQIIFDKLSTTQGAAEAAARTFAGSLDTLGENFTNLGIELVKNGVLIIVLQKAVDGLASLFLTLEENTKIVQAAFIGLLALGLPVIFKTLTVIVNALAAAFLKLALAMLTTPVGILATLIASAVGILIFREEIEKAAENGSKFAKVLQRVIDLLDKLKNIAKRAAVTVANVFEQAVEGILLLTTTDRDLREFIADEVFERNEKRLESFNKNLEALQRFGEVPIPNLRPVTSEADDINKKIAAVLEKFKDLPEELKKAKKEAKKLKKEIDPLEKIFENAARNIQRSFSDTFFEIFRNGKLSFEKLGDSIKDVFARTLAEMATLAIARPIIVPIVQAAGQLFGAQGAAERVTARFGGVGGGGIPSLRGLFGGGAPNVQPGTAGAPAIGTPGFGGAVSGVGGGTGLLGGTTGLLGGILGGTGLGALGGGVLANILGTNETGGAVGGAIGATIGSIVPVIGTVIGGIIGSIAGGLFGPSQRMQISQFTARISQEGLQDIQIQTKRASDEFAKSLLGNIEGFFNNVIETTGAQFKTQPLLVGGTSNIAGTLLELIPDITTGQRIGFQFDPEDPESLQTALGGITVEMLKLANGLEENLKIALQNIVTEGRNAEEIFKDINFALAFDTLDEAPEKLSQIEEELIILNQIFDQATETARRLGLAEEKVTQARKDQIGFVRTEFEKSIQLAITDIIDPTLAALKRLDAEFKLIRADAIALGADLKLVDELLILKIGQALKDQSNLQIQALETQRNELLTTISAFDRFALSLRRFRGDLLLDPELTILSPQERLIEAERQFEEIAEKAIAGDIVALNELQSISRSFLEASRDFFASGEEFGKDFNEVQVALIKAEQASEAQKIVAQQQVTSINQQITVLEQIAQNTKDNLQVSMQSFGNNVELNKKLAAASGFRGDFGEGRFQRFIRSEAATEAQREGARIVLRAIGAAPGFQAGGIANPGLAIVGEQGPELVNFGSQSRVTNATDTSQIFNRNNNSIVFAIERQTVEIIDFKELSKVETKALQDELIVIKEDNERIRFELERAAAKP